MTEKTEYTVTGLTQNDTMQCGDVSDRHNHNGSNMVKQRVTQEDTVHDHVSMFTSMF